MRHFRFAYPQEDADEGGVLIAAVLVTPGVMHDDRPRGPWTCTGCLRSVNEDRCDGCGRERPR